MSFGSYPSSQNKQYTEEEEEKQKLINAIGHQRAHPLTHGQLS